MEFDGILKEKWNVEISLKSKRMKIGDWTFLEFSHLIHCLNLGETLSIIKIPL